MIVIGLTGGIGTGKSEVSRILGQLGAAIIDADKVGHEAYKPHTEAWHDVVNAFGREVLQPDGEVDRKKLGAVVFGDPQALERLNAIMHPRMYSMIEERIQGLKKQGVEAAVLEAAILIEAKWTPLVDEVWVTTSTEDVAVRRIQGRNNLPEEAVRSRIRSQMSQEERAKHADVIIDNSGDLAQLKERVDALWHSRVKERANKR